MPKRNLDLEYQFSTAQAIIEAMGALADSIDDAHESGESVEPFTIALRSMSDDGARKIGDGVEALVMGAGCGSN